MSPKQWLACAALVALPFAATAEQYESRHRPADADAPVGATHYESAFRNYRSLNDDHPRPDEAWRTANDKVGKLGGHVGHVGHVGHAGSSAAGPSERAQTPATPTDRGDADGHGRGHQH